ncbi:MAG TPA: ABC transporter ATP-binding protein [Chthoniobacterales bacterium]|nr:ABC transporter ATP-binding protein [Chthoniobacterales bacterium]
MYAIETTALTRTFRRKIAVEDLTLKVPSSTVFGFLGPNGAGKTTTVRMLAGLLPPSSGTGVVAGCPLNGNLDRLRRRIGFLTESPGLYEQLTAWQNLLFFARLYGLSEKSAQSQVEKYLKLLGCWEDRHKPVGSFSKGMRQKTAIVRALAHEPEILFLDEPSSGLDPATARFFRDFVKSLRASGRTIFLTTHNLAEAEDICDYIAIMKTRLILEGSQSQIRSELAGTVVTIRFCTPPESWLPIVQQLEYAQEVTVTQSVLRVNLVDPQRDTPKLIRALIEAGAEIYAVEPARKSLEEIYLELLDSVAVTDREQFANAQ